AGRPCSLSGADGSSLRHPAFLADDPADAQKLARRMLVEADDVVQKLARLPEDAALLIRKAHAEIAAFNGLQYFQKLLDLRDVGRRKLVQFRKPAAGRAPRAQ